MDLSFNNFILRDLAFYARFKQLTEDLTNFFSPGDLVLNSPPKHNSALLNKIHFNLRVFMGIFLLCLSLFSTILACVSYASCPASAAAYSAFDVTVDQIGPGSIL